MPNNLINWNEAFSVGIEIIEAQHRQFADIINKFFMKFQEGNAEDIVSEILDDMDKYSKLHEVEEKFLSDNKYPLLNEQIEMHKNYKNRLAEFKEKQNSKNIHYDIFGFMKTWWTEHIMKEDMKYKNI